MNTFGRSSWAGDEGSEISNVFDQDNNKNSQNSALVDDNSSEGGTSKTLPESGLNDSVVGPPEVLDVNDDDEANYLLRWSFENGYLIESVNTSRDILTNPGPA